MFFEAIFEPSAQTDYNADAKKLTGKRIAVLDGWIVKDGPFKGQHGFYIPSSTVGWIPIGDLKELKPISLVRWKEIHKTLGFED